MESSTPSGSPRYRFERYLAEGGMGTLFLGRKYGPAGFERPVVLKQLRAEHAAGPELHELFFREAKLSGALDHVNLVRTLDLARIGRSFFIVMEYVDGGDLRTLIRRARARRRAMAPGAVLHMGLELLAGLAFAHGRRGRNGAPLGIVHRDVSPSNVLVSREGDVKLSDFGIATLVSERLGPVLREIGPVRGKVGYMAPEQIRRDSAVDGRCDLFSLAVCLYESLTAERLFFADAHTPPDLVYARRAPSLRDKRPDVPPALDQVLQKALALDPADRFADAASFAQALRTVAQRTGMAWNARSLLLHLVDVCGDPSTWREERPAAPGGHTGTVVLQESVASIPRPPVARTVTVASANVRRNAS
jgi:eukaryotic-like serine/threonine-protein kinase